MYRGSAHRALFTRGLEVLVSNPIEIARRQRHDLDSADILPTTVLPLQLVSTVT